MGVSWMVGLRGGGTGTQGREQREHHTKRKPTIQQGDANGEETKKRRERAIKDDFFLATRARLLLSPLFYREARIAHYGATRLMSLGNIEHSFTFAIPMPRKQAVIRSRPMGCVYAAYPVYPRLGYSDACSPLYLRCISAVPSRAPQARISPAPIAPRRQPHSATQPK